MLVYIETRLIEFPLVLADNIAPTVPVVLDENHVVFVGAVWEIIDHPYIVGAYSAKMEDTIA
jgi:hypothetical protein